MLNHRIGIIPNGDLPILITPKPWRRISCGICDMPSFGHTSLPPNFSVIFEPFIHFCALFAKSSPIHTASIADKLTHPSFSYLSSILSTKMPGSPACERYYLNSFPSLFPARLLREQLPVCFLQLCVFRSTSRHACMPCAFFAFFASRSYWRSRGYHVAKGRVEEVADPFCIRRCYNTMVADVFFAWHTYYWT
jgi:hypothetical protein